MDQKLLSALNNLSLALEEIANSLKSKESPKSATSEALKSGNLDKHLKSIDIGVKKLQADNKKILKNQDTIINLSKSKHTDKNPFEVTSDKKQKTKIKDGLGIILMIATGVLAIGLAFKIVGKVNFLSVISLAIALPLVAMAFEKIAKMKDLKVADVGRLLLVCVGIATAITLSSIILQGVQPIGIFQLITSIFIAGMFAVVSYSIGKLMANLKDVDIKNVWKLPVVMIGVSLAIALSSIPLSMVRPVGIFQLFTAVFIAAMFGAVSFGLGKLFSSVKDIGAGQADEIALLLPVVLLGVATAIALSSVPLSMIAPIGLFQFFTAVMISIVFIPISYALPYIINAIKDIDTKKLVILPIVMVAMAATIWLTSKIFSKVDPIGIGLLFSIVAQAITISIIGLALGTTLKFLANVGLQDLAMGAIGLVIIAATVLAASKILSLGSYDKYPDIKWAAGVGLSMLAFGASAVVLGLIAMSGFGILDILAGCEMILVIALTVVATAEILGKGNYTKYPPIEWSASMALSMAAFGAGSLLLGALIVGTLGLGALALSAGNIAILSIADTIRETSLRLQGGTYTGGPTKDWAEGISLTLGAFAPIYGMMMDSNIFDLFKGKTKPEEFVEAIKTITSGIVTAGNMFSLTKSTFTGGPTKEWAEGVGLAIGAFAPVYKVLSESKGWFSKGPTVEEMSKSIEIISQGIVTAANFFAKNTGVFDITKVPSRKWGDSVGGAIQAFMPALKFISDNNTWFGSGSDKLTDGIASVSSAIVTASKSLADGKYDNNIPSGYMQNISNNVRTYVDLAKYIQDSGVGTLGVIGMVFGMRKLASGYERMAEGVSKLGKELDKIDTDKLLALKNLTGSIVMLSLMDSDQFEKMMNALEDKAKIFVNIMNDIESSNEPITKGTKGAGGSLIKQNIKGGDQQKTINDLYGVMVSVNQNLSTIAKSNDNLSKYVDEIRGGDLSLKKKK